MSAAEDENIKLSTLSSQDSPTDAARFLMGCATAFQMQASCDFDDALAKLDTGASFDFITKSDAYKAMRLGWAYFFTNTTVIVGNQIGPIYVVAFYNPFLDAAVISQWKVIQGKPQIVCATLRSGEELAGNRLASRPGVPRWINSGKPVGTALAEQYQQFIAVFSKKFPAEAQTAWGDLQQASAPTLTMTDVSAKLALLQLHLLQNGPDKDLAKAVRSFRSAWSEGDTAKLEAMVPQESAVTAAVLAAMPKTFRQRAVPVYAVVKEKDTLVVIADPTALRFATLVRFTASPKTRLTSVTFLDLAATAEETSSPSSKKGS